MENNSSVSYDLVVEIISRLPVKGLMRFTSVSKSWFSLISSNSHFSDLQFERAASSDPPLVILKTVSYPNIYHDLFDSDSLEEPDKGLPQIHNPFHDDDDSTPPDFEVLCSCDGLLVLRQVGTGSLALLNPSTGKYHLVPPNPSGNQKVVFAGFGHDNASKLYKLVTFTNPLSFLTDGFLNLIIYEVNGKFGERRCLLGSYPFYIMSFRWCTDMHYAYVFIGNGFYWSYLLADCPMRIFGFSLADAQLFEVDCGFVSNATMVEFDGRLCLTYELKELHYGNGKERINIFVLDDDRWVKLFSISDPKSQFASFDSVFR